MEKLLGLYALPYDEAFPLLCFDERPCDLIEQTLLPVAMQPGRVKRDDYNYSVKASCCVLLAVEPLTGRRWLKLYDQRRRQEYTAFLQYLEEQFPHANKIKRVQDNLNTHSPASFYARLQAQEALDLSHRSELHYTPKPASYLNMAELAFSALSKQCLDRPMADDVLEADLKACCIERNAQQVRLHSQFSLQDARATFAQHYRAINVSYTYLTM